jgi:hypothetical protein
MRAMFVLTPPESKRLIGKAVASMEAVKEAMKSDRILISHGSTNVYVMEELLGREKVAALWKRERYVSGILTRGFLCPSEAKDKPPILVLNRGELEAPAPTMAEMLRDFGGKSVFIKGANAVDPEGNAAVLVANPEGGTIGYSLGMILARGIRLIAPVGLEKMIPSVKQALGVCGQQTFDYCQGLRVGMIPMPGATVVTEIAALKMLFGVEACHVASGGTGGSEGAVALVAEGNADAVREAIRLIESIKGEPPLQTVKETCLICAPASPAQPKGVPPPQKGPRCMYAGKKDEEIPPYLRKC